MHACLQGIVGDTYDRFIMGETAVSDPKSQLYLPADVSIILLLCLQKEHCSVLDISHILQEAINIAARFVLRFCFKSCWAELGDDLFAFRSTDVLRT